MFVTHSSPERGTYWFALENEVPHDRPEFAGCEWRSVKRLLDGIEPRDRPKDFDDLCLYAYGRGFLRGTAKPGDESWQYEPVMILRWQEHDGSYRLERLALLTRLIEETHETAMGYLLAELRVLGETHAAENRQPALA